MTSYSKVPTRLAVALLLKYGEISLGEIRALPLIKDEEHALAIAHALTTWFDVEHYEQRVGQAGFQVDDVIRLVALPTSLNLQEKQKLGIRL